MAPRFPISNVYRSSLLAWIGIMVFSGAAVSRAAEAGSDWQTNFTQAKSLAADRNHYLLLDFTGSDWCPWCVKMDKEVFARREFTDFAVKNLVLVKLDFPRSKSQPASEKAQNQALAETFRIEGYPTYVLLDPNGKEVRRQVGYLEGGPSGFIRWIGLQDASSQAN